MAIKYKNEILESRLSREQIRAISLQKELGKEIAMIYPEIAEDYRSGRFILSIVRKYHIPRDYHIKSITARHAVRNALEILLSEKERQQLKEQHIKKNNERMRKKKIGIFSLSKKERMEARSDGGKIGGKRAYEMRKGAHALYTPWSKEERVYLLALCKLPKYQQTRQYKGNPNYKLISEELEKRFGVRRTRSALEITTRRLFKTQLTHNGRKN